MPPPTTGGEGIMCSDHPAGRPSVRGWSVNTWTDFNETWHKYSSCNGHTAEEVFKVRGQRSRSLKVSSGNCTIIIRIYTRQRAPPAVYKCVNARLAEA